MKKLSIWIDGHNKEIEYNKENMFPSNKTIFTIQKFEENKLIVENNVMKEERRIPIYIH